MNFRFTVVERSLNRAEFRWKWLKLWRYSFVLGGIGCFFLLGLGGAILAGWLTNKGLALSLIGIGVVLAFIAWFALLISVMAGRADRNWLARAIERVDSRLLDRLNTLLFLESRRGDARTESFALRIAKQTQGLLAQKTTPRPFQRSQTGLYFCAFLVLLTATVFLFQVYSPWKRLVAADKSRLTRHRGPDNPLDLALPSTNNVEQNRTWGEVRITEPGADLKVTKLDVVPLQIEAAANQSLKKVAWHSAINGANEAEHSLPPPGEPRYAVYQPAVYLDEFRLSDWDVMTYYARASTESENAYGSEIYFLEVRPFREDILKMPGGESGQAYKCLNEMSALINRQQHVIRQTHQHLQKPPELENLRQQDRKKLSEAEEDLADSAQHLYARMAAEMENKPIGEALDNLAKAQDSLEKASRQLSANAMNDAQSRERQALAEMVAARKMFQKAVSDNPSAFDEPKHDEEPAPVADSTKKIQQMTEYRNEAKAVQDFVQQTLEQQKALEKQASSARRNDLSKIGQQEKQLEEKLKEFEQEHARMFTGTEEASQKAHEAMKKAAESLQQRNNNASEAMRQASQSLEKLSQSTQSRSADQQLADAYKLKQMLDKQIQTFSKCSNPGSGISGADLQKTTGEARDTVNQLKKIAEQEPTRDAFDQPLRDALSGQNKVDLDASLTRVQQAQTEEDKQQGASEAKDQLSKISQAFAESQPKATKMAQQSDSLKSSSQDSFQQGMHELESLLKQVQRENPISREDQAKQGREALYNLQLGLRSQYGDNDRGNQIYLQLQELLKAETPLEVADLKKLMDELQHFSVETSDRLAKKNDKPEITNIDPAKLPPAYRGRIQKYFQKLSEK
jgi:hypothetical protein